MTPVEIVRGNGAVVLGMPHTGTWLPDDIVENLNERGRRLSDTDWHVERLYEGLVADATIVRATFHRYVVDANRDPSGESLYPGQATTGLVPLTDFDGDPIWKTAPDEHELNRRRAAFHAPYHAALSAELERVRARNGHAILWDCHSIRSVIPYLFDGTLPDLSIGTDRGTTCHPALERRVAEACRTSRFSCVLNGRFRGGWTTRHYGRPQDGIHAIQMEIAQSAYLEAEEPPWRYSDSKAAPLRGLLADILNDLAAWRPA